MTTFLHQTESVQISCVQRACQLILPPWQCPQHTQDDTACETQWFWRAALRGKQVAGPAQFGEKLGYASDNASKHSNEQK